MLRRAFLALLLVPSLHARETAPTNPLFAEATAQFTTMTSTFYQWKTEVDRAAGIFRYDCVGFVSHALKQAAPEARASAFAALEIPKGRIPSPPKYRDFFASLAAHPRPGWQAVTRAADLQPGDIISWEHKTTSATGHAVILAGAPRALEAADEAGGGTAEWQVEVYDSTSSPHTDDSRPEDQRAQPLPSNGRRGGLGRGTMIILADSKTGSLTGLRWSLKAKRVLVPIAAARALK